MNGSLGTLTVSKPGSGTPGSLTVGNTITIGRAVAGNAGTGNLNIAGGASMTTMGADGVQVAVFADGPFGNVSVTDSGSYISTARFTLGAITGHATLTIQNAAQLLCGDASIAGSPFFAGGSSTVGSATVTGANSLWAIDSATAFNVGYFGNGTLTISNGGIVADHRSTIATNPGSIGNATVTGPGSLWDHQGGDIYVGGTADSSASGGTGALHVLSGGLLKASLLKIFDTATVEINNGSSTVPGLLISGDVPAHMAGGTFGELTVGSTGAGRMELRNGGSVSSSRGYIGFANGAEGSVLVTGSGTQATFWQATGSIFVGNGGNGTLEVRNGANVTSDNNGYLAFGNNTTGYAIVSGASWTTAQNLYVGGNAAGPGGNGTLQIENGGTVTATTTTIYNTGALLLSGIPALESTNTFLGGSAQMLANTSFGNAFSLGAGGIHIYTNFFDAIFFGQISGAGALDKAGSFTIGPGTLSLTNSNTYAGGTTVSAGRLLANNSSGSATGTGAV
ncbi:MAG: autotransporter-associated beta strand repeat-containing protein, partial [Chthoniobacterales bacterium]